MTQIDPNGIPDLPQPPEQDPHLPSAATHDLRHSQGASLGNTGTIEQQYGDRITIHNYGPAATPANPAPDDPNAESPFKGLLAFDVADAERFFGREALTEALMSRSQARPCG